MSRLIVANDENKALFGDYVPMEATNIFHNEQIVVEGQGPDGKPALFEGGTVQSGTGFRCHVNVAKELFAAGMAKGAGGFDPETAEASELRPHFQVSAHDLPGGSQAISSYAAAQQSGFKPNTAPEGFVSNGSDASKPGDAAKPGDASKTDKK